MRVLFDARYTRLGRHDGISRFTAALATELANLADVELLVSDERQLAMLPELPWHLGPDPTSALEPLAALRVNRIRLGGPSVAVRPDVVFTPMQTMGSLGRRYPLVVTVHDLIYYRYRTSPRSLPPLVRLVWRLYHLAWWPQRLLLNGADAVAVVSQTTRELIAQHRLTGRPVFVVGNAPAEPSEETRDAARGHLPQTEPRTVVHMGQFLPYKNVEALARAAQWLPGYEVRFMSAVSETERARLRALSGEAADRLVFLNGATDAEYEKELLRATALVTTSWDEGFGIPVVEAMRLGVPVVASDIAIFREVGGSAAVFVDPADPRDVARGIRSLEDPGEWAARSAAASAQAARFDWAGSARALYEALSAAVSSRLSSSKPSSAASTLKRTSSS